MLAKPTIEFSVSECQRIRKYEQRVGVFSHDGRECLGKPGRSRHFHELQVNSQQGCGGPQLVQRHFRWRDGGIPENRNARGVGKCLFEQRHTLGCQFRGKRGYAGDIFSRPCKAGDKPKLHGVAGVSHHDGDPAGRVLRSLSCRGGRRQYHFDVEGNEFSGKCRKPVCLARRKPSLNGNILSLDPATFPQSLQEGSAPIDVMERCKAAAGR